MENDCVEKSKPMNKCSEKDLARFKDIEIKTKKK